MLPSTIELWLWHDSSQQSVSFKMKTNIHLGNLMIVVIMIKWGERERERERETCM